MKEELEAVFLSKTRDEWCAIMEERDVCFAPVLDFIEAQKHPHNVERNTYIEVEGMVQPAPAPRFSRTVSEVQSGAPAAGEHTEEVLKDWGIKFP
ncbi:MAG: CoA transferase [Chitinophagales bacterium]